MEEIVSHDNIGGYVLTSADNIVESVRVNNDWHINFITDYKVSDYGNAIDVHPVTGERLDHE